MNIAMIIGRITKIENLENSVKIILSVNREHKNKEGVYETDFITCILKDNIAKKCKEYCKIGNILGVKGSLKTGGSHTYVLVNKLTFLSTKGGEI